MKYLFLSFLFCFPYLSSAQEMGGREIMKEGTYLYPEKIAQPKNGLDSFYIDFAQNFDFTTLSNPSIIEFKCVLEFFVEKDGSLTNINTIMDSYNAGKEAIRLLKSMPKWKPATEKGEIVRSKYKLNLHIKKPVN